MSELLQILAIGLVLYAMKAVPFAWRLVPRTALADRIFDLLPVALLMAMLLPPVLLPLLAAPAIDGALPLVAVVASFIVCAWTDRAALGIGAGLALLALAEFV